MICAAIQLVIFGYLVKSIVEIVSSWSSDSDDY